MHNRMKKKHISRKARHASRATRPTKVKEGYLVVVRSWMLLVMFALMLGLGAVVGTYLNTASDPAVAGAQIEVR